jgi:2-haloacid dehalogenase
MTGTSVYVFDAYGTLFDVHAAIARHRAAAGPDADRFSEIWRLKQLEYAWTLTLAGHYADFWTLTERALDYAFERVPTVSRALRTNLLDAYLTLQASGIAALCDAILSVDTVRMYKPRPEVYALVTGRFGVKPDAVVFASSNRWDIMGAASFGFRPVWVNRSRMPEEYPDKPPIRVVPDLSALASVTL